MSSAESSAPGRVHAIIRGRVQRVFFRASTEEQACRLGLSGWVRNRPDGAVELVAEGSRPALEALLAWCGHGPQRAVVQDLEVNWQDHQGEFTVFSVKR